MEIDPGWIFLIIGLFCGIALIVLMLLGGMDFDVDAGVDADVGMDHDIGGHGGPSPLSLPVIFSFGMVFGVSGYIAEFYYGDPIMSSIIATALGIVTSIMMYLLMLYLFKMGEASTDFKAEDVVGEQGDVTIPIEKGKIGQVLVITETRGRTLVTATSDYELPAHTRVNIIGMSGDRVIVEPAQSQKQTQKEITKKKKEA